MANLLVISHDFWIVYASIYHLNHIIYNHTSTSSGGKDMFVVVVVVVDLSVLWYLLVVGEPSLYDFRIMDVPYIYVKGYFTAEAGQEHCSTLFGIDGSLAYFDSNDQKVSMTLDKIQ